MSVVRILDDKARNSWVDHYPGFLLQDAADKLQCFLMRSAPFEPDRPVGAWKPWDTDRTACAYGHKGTAYSYAGVFHQTHPWPEELRDLRKQLEAYGTFNYVLCNHYPDGRAGMGWHSDAEAELVPGAPIASVSLGATRDFVFRLGREGKAVASVALAHGDLLVMGGETQRWFQHRLPERTRVNGRRINLTFRHVRVRRAQE